MGEADYGNIDTFFQTKWAGVPAWELTGDWGERLIFEPTESAEGPFDPDEVLKEIDNAPCQIDHSSAARAVGVAGRSVAGGQLAGASSLDSREPGFLS